MTTALRTLLNAAIDLLEAVELPEPNLPDTAQKTAQKAARGIAQSLTPADFGGSTEARIGLNYMKGEIEVLTEERDHARKRASDTYDLLRFEQNEHRQDNYDNQKQCTDLTIENIRLTNILGSNGIEWEKVV